MNFCVIPARGGSKRIPKKNIRDFLGKPIIIRTIETVLKAKIFDKVILSSDDSEVINLVKELDIEVPFLRPKNISDDFSSTIDVMEHSSKWINEHYKKINNICCVYPCSPLLTAEDLKIGLEEIKKNNWDYVFSAYECKIPLYRSFKKNDDGGVDMLFPKNFNVRTQDLQKIYIDAAQFYFGKKDSWISKKIIFSKKSLPLILPEDRVQDIDTESDWNEAERKFKQYYSS